MTDRWTWRDETRWWLRKQSWLVGNAESLAGRRYANTGARGPGHNPSWTWRLQKAIARPRTPLWYERQLRREREWVAARRVARNIPTIPRSRF